MRYNRGSIEDTGRVALIHAKRTGKVCYIVPTANGLTIEESQPHFVNFHVCYPDGHHEYHKYQTGCPTAS